MKKLALILALMLIPCTAFGMEMLDDSSMDGITGQSGVSIAFDDVQVFLNIEKLGYIDCDGFTSLGTAGTCSGDPGAVFLNNFQIDVLNVNAIVATSGDAASNQLPGAQGSGSGLGLKSVSCGSIPLFYDYATSTGFGCNFNSVGGRTQTLGLDNYRGVAGHLSTFVPRFLTIDVTDDLPAASEGFVYKRDSAWTSGLLAAAGVNSASSVGGILIGIPTAEIYINKMSLTPMYDGDVNGYTSSAANDNDVVNLITGQRATYGTISMVGITFTPLGGWIEIAAH
jgi:hypothetical protein